VGVNTISGLGYKPNFVLFKSVGWNALTNNSHAWLGFGAAHNNSSDTVSQGYVAVASNHNATEENASVVARDDCSIGQLQSGIQSWKASAESFGSDGFSLNTGSDDASSDYIFYLAMDTGVTDGIDVSVVDSPTSTGAWAVTDPAFTPQLVIGGLTSAPSINSGLAQDPISFGLSMFDGTTEVCAGVDFDDAATTTDVQSNFSATEAIETYHYSGGHSKFYEGTFTSFDTDTGYTLGFTTVNGTARKWLSVALQSTGEQQQQLQQVQLPRS
jgi:hypothetical protein